MYIEGLKKEGVIKDGDGNAPRTVASPGSPQTSPLVDYASGQPIPPGFQTRRAG